MGRIADNLADTIADYEKEFEKEPNYHDLNEAVIEYHEMLRLAIVKEKGYNLIRIDQTDIKPPSFNSN